MNVHVHPDVIATERRLPFGRIVLVLVSYARYDPHRIADRIPLDPKPRHLDRDRIGPKCYKGTDQLRISRIDPVNDLKRTVGVCCCAFGPAVSSDHSRGI
jgi:hypothetical protein